MDLSGKNQVCCALVREKYELRESVGFSGNHEESWKVQYHIRNLSEP